MKSGEQLTRQRIVKVGLRGKRTRVTDTLAREEPLEIRVKGKSVAVTMRTPGLDRELAAGFLVSEGVVKRGADIVEIAPCRGADDPENVLNVFLAPGVKVDFQILTRHVFASSSCGVCGKASIEAVHQQVEPLRPGMTVSARTIAALPQKMRRAQKTFAVTGGLHAAAVFDALGNLLFSAEDVGRHNAVDKVIGWALLNGRLPLSETVLLVSGRASFEIVQKALAAGIPVVAAVSAPSNLAVDLAKENGQTLVGFLRGETMNVYAGERRVTRDGKEWGRRGRRSASHHRPYRRE
jgi:FdhD protein